MKLRSRNKKISKYAFLCVFTFFFLNQYEQNLHAKTKKYIDSYQYKESSNKKNQYNGPKIILNGAENVSVQMIERMISHNLNNKITEENLNKLLILLYKTNLFHDIKIDYRNNILYIDFKESKIIRRFKINGDKELKDKALKELIDLSPGQIFNEHEFIATIKKINEFYKNHGYFNVIVEKKIKLSNDKFVDIEVNIIKGKVPKISEIVFVGNTKISSEELKEEGLFREKSLLRFLSKKTRFHTDAIKLNAENLQKFYHRNGYLNYKLLNQEVIFDPRENEIKLIFEVNEGHQFVIQDIDIKTKFSLNSEIQKIINSAKGQIFNKLKFENDVKIIKKILNKSKINADVVFAYENLNDHGSIKLIYEIVPARNNFIRNIVISGNGRTKDSVIRNQIVMHEGDLFNPDAIETSYRRIYNLGFFESIDIDYKKSPENDTVDLFIEVEEKKTGEIHLGGGYSSVNGIFGEVTYHENNVFGTGNVAGFSVQKGRNHFSLSSSYYQNNIFDTILGAGVSAFYDDYKNEKLYFNNKDYGGTLNTAIPLYEDLSLRLRYLLKFNKIYKVGENASDTVKNQERDTITSALLYQFVYDKRNLIDYPTSGYYVNFSQDFAGLGGDKFSVSTELTTRYYKTLFNFGEIQSNKNAVVLQLKNNFGIIRPYNDYVLRIEDRFFLSELRGFRQVSGVSPRDKDKKVIGGDRYFYGSAQIETPINLIQDFDLKAHAFIDYGKILVEKENIFSKKDILDGKDIILNSDKLRISAGIGVYMITPIAPLSLAIAWPLRYDSELDKKKSIYFALNKRV